MPELEYLVGLRVGQISFGLGVTLDLRGEPATDTVAKLDAGPVKYESAAGSIVELAASENVGSQYAPLLALYRCAITSARVEEDANVLELVFETGDRFSALPMPDVEGWQLTGPGNRFIVAVPGGEVATWG
jgi:hypothetical protein